MELLFILIYMCLSVLLALVIPLALILLSIAILQRNAPKFNEYQKDLIHTIGKEMRKTKETNGTIDNKDLNAIIKQYNIKDKDLINYVLKKYGKGVH